MGWFGMRGDWMSELTRRGQHAVFRLSAIGFSVYSSLAVYAVFSSLDDEGFHHYVNIWTTICFVLLGYFALRGLAHRMKEGRAIGTHLIVAAFYLFFEVICNLAYASLKFGDVAWIHGLYNLISVFRPFAVASMPVFGILLAWLDVDLMREKGMVLPTPVAVPVQQGPSAPGPKSQTASGAGPMQQGQQGQANRQSAQQGQVRQGQQAQQRPPAQPAQPVQSSQASYEQPQAAYPNPPGVQQGQQGRSTGQSSGSGGWNWPWKPVSPPVGSSNGSGN